MRSRPREELLAGGSGGGCRIAEHAARAHVGQKERVVLVRDRLEGGGHGVADERRRHRQHRRRLGLPGMTDRAEVDGKELAQEGRLDEVPVVDEATVLGEREGAEPATVAAMAVDDHDLVEPRPQAAHDRPGQLEQELRLERHGDAESHVVWAEPGPDGRRNDRVPAREVRRTQADRLDEQRIGADRQVLAVLLERADGQQADGAGATPLARRSPGKLAEPVHAH